jgi:hypothetical protein|tara:strand:+ start:29 stop:316 length:288 start_codon:yes stop_codon:yes gene_type:complete
MANYAKVVNNVVTKVIVADASYINSLVENEPGFWVESDKAGIGYSYDGTGFYAPKPFDSWTLNTDTYMWEPPVAYPANGNPHVWNESTQTWDAVE